jgi:hypothetical protein
MNIIQEKYSQHILFGAKLVQKLLNLIRLYVFLQF